MNNSFGDFLKEKRQEQNLTQKELAKILFVSESAVSKWERNAARPDIALLSALANTLNITEHELLTASVDTQARKEKAQARKWRALTSFWHLFFYISYGIALLTCFICNLAVNKTLSWFWIVVTSLLLAFTFTNLPALIKKHKLLLMPLSNFLALCALLMVCAIYTNGDWFWIATLSVFLGLVIIFAPIYIAKYEIFSKLKKYNDFVSVGIDFVLLNILLIVINSYSSQTWWYLTIALPIVTGVYLLLNLLLSVRFLKINRFLKTSILLAIINAVIYIPPLFLKVKSPEIQEEIDQINIFNANFSVWTVDLTLEANIHCIIFLTMALVSLIFLAVGLIRFQKNNRA